VALRRGPDGTSAGFRGLIYDLTKRKNYERELAESEERFRTLYENATVGLYRTTPEGRVLLANPALLRMLGYGSLEELQAVDLRKGGLGAEYSREKFFAHLRKAVVVEGAEAAWTKKDGMKITVRESARAVFDPEGRIKFCEGTVEDITDRKKAHLELQASEKKLRRVIDHSLEGIFQATAEGRVTEANKAAVRMFGFKKTAEFVGTDSFGYFVDAGMRDVILSKIKNELEVRNLEVDLRRKDGTIFHALANATVLLGAEGNVDHIEIMLADITDLVRSKAELQTALREKDALIKDIHFRVMNNMQLISNLFFLQSRRLKDPEAIRILEDGQDRVRAIAHVHESLYRHSSFSRVDMSAYLRDLISSRIVSDPRFTDRIRLRIDVDPVSFDVKTAVAVGMIADELVSNAFKHAFPGDCAGTVALDLHQQGEGTFRLSVRDDGRGFPPEIHPGRSETMGLQTVETLVEQLKGRLETSPPPGAEIAVFFREPKT